MTAFNTGWPCDPETGQPMAIVSVATKEHIGSGHGLPDYGGLDIGPISVASPCANDAETIEKTAREYQRLCQFIVGTERRAIQWSIDPSLKPLHPDEIKKEIAEEAAKVETETVVETPEDSEKKDTAEPTAAEVDAAVDGEKAEKK